MNIAPAIAAALEAIPPDERSVDVELVTRRLVRANAIRLTNIARSMLADNDLPKISVGLILAAIADDVLGTPSRQSNDRQMANEA